MRFLEVDELESHETPLDRSRLERVQANSLVLERLDTGESDPEPCIAENAPLTPSPIVGRGDGPGEFEGLSWDPATRLRHRLEVELALIGPVEKPPDGAF